MDGLSPFLERRWDADPYTPIIELTLDGNMHITYRNSLGGTTWMDVDINDNTVDLTRISDDFVEEHLLEPLEDAGFDVVYETDEPEPGIIRRIVTFIFP